MGSRVSVQGNAYKYSEHQMVTYDNAPAQGKAKQSVATEGLASIASFVVPAFQINPVNNWMHFLSLEIE